MPKSVEFLYSSPHDMFENSSIHLQKFTLQEIGKAETTKGEYSLCCSEKRKEEIEKRRHWL